MANDLEALCGKLSPTEQEQEQEVISVDDDVVQENLVHGEKCLIV